MTLVDWHFRSGDSMHSFFDPHIVYERLFAPFQLFPGVVLPPDEYRFTRARFNVMTAQRRRIQGTLNFSFGPYWSGRAETLQTGLTLRLPPKFSFAFNTNQTFARLPQRNFVARVITSQVNFSPSPALTFSNLVQYDNQSRNLGWQSRARWILNPGNDVFVAFNQGWLQNPEGGYRFRTADSKVSAKVQYTVRF